MRIQILHSLVVALCICYGVHSSLITVKNNCPYQLWPATLTRKGPAALTGFELASQASKTLDIPSPWSGTFWARFQCYVQNKFICESGDCSSGKVECNGSGATLPASLVEFTLGGDGGNDFYDISLVDGFNIPVSVLPDRAGCRATTCPSDINGGCPFALYVKDRKGRVVGCKGACDALNEPQYCCTGAYGTPYTCKPTNYSQIFKSKCPQAYSYAYDDRSSTVTCPTGGNYLVTFCP